MEFRDGIPLVSADNVEDMEILHGMAKLNNTQVVALNKRYVNAYSAPLDRWAWGNVTDITFDVIENGGYICTLAIYVRGL